MFVRSLAGHLWYQKCQKWSHWKGGYQESIIKERKQGNITQELNWTGLVELLIQIWNAWGYVLASGIGNIGNITSGFWSTTQYHAILFGRYLSGNEIIFQHGNHPKNNTKWHNISHKLALLKRAKQKRQPTSKEE